MDFGLLGPVVLLRDGREVALGGPKQRAVLAMLLLAGNEIVPRDRVIDGLWGERPPASAGHTVDNYVSRLRKLLGPDRLMWRTPGYVLRVEPGELDVDEFERRLRSGNELLAAGDPHAAARELREALRVWRGPALAELRDEPFAAPAAAHLEERRVQALEARIEADLATGGSAGLVPELERLVAEHPFRERVLGQLMRALYRSGRQGDALGAYQAGRLRLASELGLEPGTELRRLQHAILVQDPALDAPTPPRRAPVSGGSPPSCGGPLRPWRWHWRSRSSSACDPEAAQTPGPRPWVALGPGRTASCSTAPLPQPSPVPARCGSRWRTKTRSCVWIPRPAP